MRIAISGTEFDDNEPAMALVTLALQFSVSYVEFWFPTNSAAVGLERSLQEIAAAGLHIACISTGSELYRDGGSVPDQHLLIEAIELASRVGAPYVNTYFGYARRRDDDTAIAVYGRLLKPCLEAAERCGVTIVLENEFDAFRHDPVESDITRRPVVLRRLAETVGHARFQLNFDPSNFYCAGIEPFPYAYKLLRDFIAYVHVKDVARGDDSLGGRWRVFPDNDDRYATRDLGSGAVNWHGLLAALRQDDYRGFLTVEPHATVAWRAAAFESACNRLRQWGAEEVAHG
jgi:sugar phosphate isomerase/epimerase